MGAGGTAKVYRAHDLVLGVERAVKVLRGDQVIRGEMRPRLQAEARIMASLRHPNILTVYDIGNDDDCDWVVMDLASGGSLDDRLLRVGRLPVAEAVDFGLQILSGLGAAHAAGIIHRDIKPQNILLDGAGAARVADFGIALYPSPETDRLTRTGVSMGSFAYMPPEQRIDAHRVDPTADIYSVGTTLYVLLTGRTPVDLFAAEESSGRWSGLPTAIATVLRRTTRFDPRERYATALDMAQALAEAAGRELHVERFPNVPAQSVFSTTTIPRHADPTMVAPAGVTDTFQEAGFRLLPTAGPPPPTPPEETPIPSARRNVSRLIAVIAAPVLLFGPSYLYLRNRQSEVDARVAAMPEPVAAAPEAVVAPAPEAPPVVPSPEPTVAPTDAREEPPKPKPPKEAPARPVPAAPAAGGIGLGGHPEFVGTWVTSDVGGNLFLKVGGGGPEEARIGATWETGKVTRPEMSWKDGSLVVSGVSVYNVWTDVVFSDFRSNKVVGTTTGGSPRPVSLHRME